MNLPWFKLRGMVFLPASIIGWVISAIAIAGSVYLFIDIDRRSHSVSDTLITSVYNLIFISAAYTVIAFFTCKNPELETET